MAMLLAAAVRNELEAVHGGVVDPETGEHKDLPLSDDDLRMLNPRIRNVIYTVLYCLLGDDTDDPRCLPFLGFQAGTIPGYWEAPELVLAPQK
jgi:hypothetical protein